MWTDVLATTFGAGSCHVLPLCHAPHTQSNYGTERHDPKVVRRKRTQESASKNDDSTSKDFLCGT